MEQLVPLAAACLPLMAALALILHFWPRCPRGPQCGNVIQQMSSGSGLQSVFGRGVGREESCPSRRGSPGNSECVVVPSLGFGWADGSWAFHLCPFLALDFDQLLQPVEPQFLLCEKGMVIAPTSQGGCEDLDGLLEVPSGTSCSCLPG